MNIFIYDLHMMVYIKMKKKTAKSIQLFGGGGGHGGGVTVKGRSPDS